MPDAAASVTLRDPSERPAVPLCHVGVGASGHECAGFTSPWMTIDQAMITAFADVTLDHQAIHVDPAAAASSPFGDTVAHGFLLLALLPRLHALSGRPDAGAQVAINYGLDRVRFVMPVRSGSRIRGRFALVERSETSPGIVREVLDAAIELVGVERPVMIARWLRQLRTASQLPSRTD